MSFITLTKNAEEWAPNTSYLEGTDVCLGDFIFRCKASHRSRTSLMSDADKWDCKTPGLEIVKQIGHDFIPMTAIRLEGSTYIKAIATSYDNVSNPPKVVISVNGDYFLIAIGYVSLRVVGHGLNVDQVYYLSATQAGAITTTPPNNIGVFIVPILRPTDSNTIEVLSFECVSTSTDAQTVQGYSPSVDVASGKKIVVYDINGNIPGAATIMDIFKFS